MPGPLTLKTSRWEYNTTMGEFLEHSGEVISVVNRRSDDPLKEVTHKYNRGEFAIESARNLLRAAGDAMTAIRKFATAPICSLREPERFIDDVANAAKHSIVSAVEFTGTLCPDTVNGLLNQVVQNHIASTPSDSKPNGSLSEGCEPSCLAINIADGEEGSDSTSPDFLDFTDPPLIRDSHGKVDISGPPRVFTDVLPNYFGDGS